MIRFILPLLLISPFAFAEQVAEPGPAPGIGTGIHVPKSIDEEAGNRACVSELAIQTYAKSSMVEKMTRHPVKVAPPRTPNGKLAKRKGGFSMLAVRLNLKANGLLIKNSDADNDRYYETDSDVPEAEKPAPPGTLQAPRDAKDAGPWLENQDFVNLLDCPKYAAKMLDAKNLPKGAIVVYAGGHSGHIEMKTASGFWSDKPRNNQGFAPKMKVLGVYIKPMY
jgi:hypothetical protein